MRYYKTIATMTVLASLTTSSVAAEPADDSPKQFIQNWTAAFNKNDPKLLASFYDKSDELEFIVSAGVRHQGHQAVEKFYRGDLAAVRYYDCKVTKISTRLLGDTVLVVFEHLVKIRFIEDDTRWQVHIRTTSVLHHIDGKWKIVLEHSSPILGTERATQIQE